MLRIVALLTVLAAAGLAFGQGKLDAVREAVDRPQASDFASTNSDCKHGMRSECSDDESDSNFYALVALMPFVWPHAAIDPGFDVKSQFLPHPYASGERGYLVLDRHDVPWADRTTFDERTDIHWYSIRASAEFGSDFDGLTRTGLRLFLDTDSRFGIKSDWDYYLERLPCGCRDQFWLGDITATYRFAQNEQIQIHTGLGARLMFDNGHDRGGFNFLYGFDAFPVQPVHLFGSFEAGSLGNAFLWRLHGGVGANWNHGELFVGYDYLNIGGATLQGPFVGLRLWF